MVEFQTPPPGEGQAWQRRPLGIIRIQLGGCCFFHPRARLALAEGILTLFLRLRHCSLEKAVSGSQQNRANLYLFNHPCRGESNFVWV